MDAPMLLNPISWNLEDGDDEAKRRAVAQADS